MSLSFSEVLDKGLLIRTAQGIEVGLPTSPHGLRAFVCVCVFFGPSSFLHTGWFAGFQVNQRMRPCRCPWKEPRQLGHRRTSGGLAHWVRRFWEPQLTSSTAQNSLPLCIIPCCSAICFGKAKLSLRGKVLSGSGGNLVPLFYSALSPLPLSPTLYTIS